MFLIEDNFHAEAQGKYSSFEEALTELKIRARIPFGEGVNKCPCTNWSSCQREYHIIEYDDSKLPWKELTRQEVLTITQNGVEWKMK